MINNTQYNKYIYWVPGSEFIKFEKDLSLSEFKMKPVKKTSCETLNAENKIVRYASPEIFNGLCNRQGSWYRASNKAGSYLVVSAERLPEKFNPFLDSNIKGSDFLPASLPGPLEKNN